MRFSKARVALTGSAASLTSLPASAETARLTRPESTIVAVRSFFTVFILRGSEKVGGGFLRKHWRVFQDDVRELINRLLDCKRRVRTRQFDDRLVGLRHFCNFRSRKSEGSGVFFGRSQTHIKHFTSEKDSRPSCQSIATDPPKIDSRRRSIRRGHVLLRSSRVPTCREPVPWSLCRT